MSHTPRSEEAGPAGSGTGGEPAAEPIVSQWQTRPVADFLRGLRVLELGDGVAGAAAGAVLGSLGADVTVVESAEAAIHALEPRLDADADGADSLLALVLRAGKRTAVTVPPSVEGFDVVIADRTDPSTAAEALDAYLRRVAEWNRRVWVTISPFGLSGPRRHWLATDFTAAASGGLLSSVHNPSTGAPVRMAGSQAWLSVGHVAALAACHGLDEARRAREPVHVDVSAQEVVVSTGPVLRVAQELMSARSPGGAARFGAPAGLYRCKDGFIHIMAMEDHQWRALVRDLGTPGWAAEYAEPLDRIERATEINAHLEEALAGLGKVAAEERFQRAGVPATAMYSPAELLSVPQYPARGSLATVRMADRQARAVRSPYLVNATGGGATRTRPGLTGLAVAEVGHVLAVPLATSLLGAMGAAVTKLEDPERLDMYRRRGPYIDGVVGIDHSAYFAFMNHSKQSRVLDLEDPSAVAAALEEADVVIENLGPRRSRNLGIDCATVAASRPGVLAVSSSGFGHRGPWAHYRAYAYNLHTSCGLAHLTRDGDGRPNQIDVAWADLISGFALATVVAAWAVGPGSPAGAAVDFSMAELAVGRFAEFLSAAALGLAAPDGQEAGASEHYRQAPFAPQGAYAGRDGRLLALSVRSETEWRSLCRVLGEPESLGRRAFSTSAGRRAHHDDLDAALEALIAGREIAGLAAALQDVGVPASPVVGGEDLIEDPQLVERGYFGEIDHPVWGRRHIIGVPWHFVGHSRLPLGAPPPLGNASGAEGTDRPGAPEGRA